MQRRKLTSGLAFSLICTGLLAVVSTAAADEYNCRNEEICVPGDDGFTGCEFSAEWGALSAGVESVHTSSWGANLWASATPIGGSAAERWIITSCDEVSFRPYAAGTAEADTYHCWEGSGESHPYPCAGVASLWLTNTAGSGSGTPLSAFCGQLVCDGVVVGTVDHKVEGIHVDQPGNLAVRVFGDASARYYEDRGAGCVLCGQSLQDEQTADDEVLFWIGSTPPL